MRHFSLLLVFLVCLLSQSSSAQTSKTALPEAKTLIEKHLAAIGGKKKLLALRSQHFKARIEPKEGRMIKGDMEIHFARVRVKDAKTGKIVDRASFRMNLQQGGVTSIICSNGRIAWQDITLADGRNFLALLSKADTATYQNMFDPSSFARFDQTFKSWKTLKKTLVRGRPAFEVKMVSKAGVTEHYSFDAKSGLMVSMKSFIESPAGVQVSKSSFSDYREVNGILTAFKTYGEGTGFKQTTITLPGGGYDVKIDPKIFAPGEAVLALTKKNPAPEPAKKNTKQE